MQPSQLTSSTKLLALLSFLGAMISAYLVYLHYTPEASTICQLGETFDCDVVNKSEYSKFLGVPVALLGSGYYIAMFLFSVIFSYKPSLFSKADLTDLFRGISLINGIGVLFTLYLTAMEAFVLHAYCIFCLAQQVVILIMGGVLFRIYRKLSRKTI